MKKSQKKSARKQKKNVTMKQAAIMIQKHYKGYRQRKVYNQLLIEKLISVRK